MTVSSICIRRLAVALPLVAIVLSGCSVAKLTYDYADWLLLRKMDAYLDLSADQTDIAMAQLGSRLEQHRREELPEYLEFLRSVRALAADGLTYEETDGIVRRGRVLAEITVERTVPAVASTMASMTPAQIGHLREHFNKVNRDFRRKYFPRSKREREIRRIRRATLRIEHWTGKLREEQRGRVAQLRGQFPETNEDWLSYNIQKQQRLLALLEERTDVEELTQFLVNWWVRLEGRSPLLERKTKESLAALTRLIVGVDETLDPLQRRFLLWRLDNYSEQIEELIAEQ